MAPQRISGRSALNGAGLNGAVLRARDSGKQTRFSEYDDCEGLHVENSYLTGRSEKDVEGACDGGADVNGRIRVGEVVLMVPGGKVKRLG